jgi:hypothetical protein
VSRPSRGPAGATPASGGIYHKRPTGDWGWTRPQQRDWARNRLEVRKREGP